MVFNFHSACFSVYFSHCLFFSTWWYRSSQIFVVSHTIELHHPTSRTSVLSHTCLIAAERSTTLHTLHRHMYSYIRKNKWHYKTCLALAEHMAIEQELHCNSRGATYQALRTQAWRTPIKGMDKAIATNPYLHLNDCYHVQISYLLRGTQKVGVYKSFPKTVISP